MGDKTAIEWTDATWLRSDSGTPRTYVRADSSRPGQQERRRRAVLGERWCRHCHAWLPTSEVHDGLCRPHTNEAYRERYAANPTAIRGRTTARKRGTAPIPADADLVAELFDGSCAYCEGAPETWDHVVPVIAGGDSVPGNIVPACRSCNSSKRDREVFGWLTATGRTPHPYLIEYLTMAEVA